MVLPKIKFVTWFSRLFPGKYCWTECVSWAYSSSAFNPFKIEKSNGCRTESLDKESCYCGQWYKGKCFSLLSDEEQKKIAELKPKGSAL